MNTLVIIGQGYVGLPLAQVACQAGYAVTGLEVNQAVVDDLNTGSSHVEDVPDIALQVMLEQGYRATTDNAVLGHEDINNSMPVYVVQRIQDLLNDHQKSLNGAKVLLLGVSYKANISDQ